MEETEFSDFQTEVGHSVQEARRRICSQAKRTGGAAAAMAFQSLVEALTESYGGKRPPEVDDKLRSFSREFFWFVNYVTS